MIIEGVVLDEEGGLPVPLVAVDGTRDPAAILGSAWESKAEAITDPGGRFRLDIPGNGPALLRAVPADEQAGGPVEVTVAAGVREVSLRLAALPILELDLRDTETDAPYEGPVRVTRGAEGAADRPALVFDTREFPNGAKPALGFPPGRHRIELALLGYHAPVPVEVDLVPGKRTPLRLDVDRDESATGLLRVRFKDADGRSVPAHMVLTVGITTFSLFEAIQGEDDEDDDLLLFRAAPGEIEVSAGGATDAPDPAHAWVRTSEVTLMEAGAVADLTLTLHRGGWLRLRGPEEDPGETYFYRGGAVRVERWFGGVDIGGPHWTVGPLPPGEWTVSFPEVARLTDLEVEIREGRLKEMEVKPTS